MRLSKAINDVLLLPSWAVGIPVFVCAVFKTVISHCPVLLGAKMKMLSSVPYHIRQEHEPLVFL